MLCPAISWDLGDLMKNGKLDVDAVSDALGLASPTPTSASGRSISHGFFGSSPVTPTPTARIDTANETTPWSPTTRNSRQDDESVLVRKCGGPLCAIPEESDDIISQSMNLNIAAGRPLSSLVERWGRVCDRESVYSTSTGVVRTSVSSSILNVDMSLLGLDISAIKPANESALEDERHLEDEDEGVQMWEEGSWRSGANDNR